MSQPGESDILRLEIAPCRNGWRVNVFLGARYVATTIENSDYEAAAIGVGLAHRAIAALLDKGNSDGE